MSGFYNYDTRPASASSQIITLERLLAEAEGQRDAAHAECDKLREGYRRLSQLVSSQGIRLMEAEDTEPGGEHARKDAQRWRAMAMLATAYAEVTVRQDEDGQWSIACAEGIEAADCRFVGRDPDAAIDAVQGQR